MSDSPDGIQFSGRTDKFDLTHGSILPTILKLAWPVVATMFVHAALVITDMIWVGRLGAAPMAAITPAVFYIWILLSMMEVISAGLVAIISRHYGAKNYEKASYAASQSISYATIFSIVISVTGYILSPVFLDIIGTDAEVARLGTEYLRIRMIGTIFFFLYEVGVSIFRATGDTKTPMVLSLIAVGGNILLDPVLIFGVGPFPAMGVAGAAWATVLSVLFAVLGLTYYLFKGKLTIDLRISDVLKLDYMLLGRMLRIGLPISLNNILFSVVYIFINMLTADYGTEAIASLGIGNRIESISYMVCVGFSVAVATMVGQNLGAGKPERAERAVWVTFGITAVFTGIISICFVVIPGLITRAFVSDPLVVDHTSDYLRILALSQVFMAALIVFEGAFSGAGDTLPPMIVGIPAAVMRLPIAYVLCKLLDVGVNGVWWAITSTTIVSAVVLVIWFRRGKWKEREIE